MKRSRGTFAALPAAATKPVACMLPCRIPALDTAIMQFRPLLRRMVQPSVIGLRHHAQVFDSVVILDAVDVMNVLPVLQRPPEMALHYHSMLQSLNSVNYNRDVPRRMPPPINGVWLGMSGSAGCRTEPRVTVRNIRTVCEERLSAMVTSAVNCRGAAMLGSHRSLLLRCRAGGVRSAARRHCARTFPHSQANSTTIDSHKLIHLGLMGVEVRALQERIDELEETG